MKREYWIDKGKIENGEYISYDCIEMYTSYKQALYVYKLEKLSIKRDEYVQFWVVDWDDQEDEMIDYKIEWTYERRSVKE